MIVAGWPGKENVVLLLSGMGDLVWQQVQKAEELNTAIAAVPASPARPLCLERLVKDKITSSG